MSGVRSDGSSSVGLVNGLFSFVSYVTDFVGKFSGLFSGFFGLFWSIFSDSPVNFVFNRFVPWVGSLLWGLVILSIGWSCFVEVVIIGYSMSTSRSGDLFDILGKWFYGNLTVIVFVFKVGVFVVGGVYMLFGVWLF